MLFRSEIVERTQSNPKYYEKMSALLCELIEKRKNDVINYEAYLRQIVELARTVSYTHLDVYKRQGPCRNCSPGKNAGQVSAKSGVDLDWEK